MTQAVEESPLPTARPELPEIIHRYHNGESVQDIAKEFKVAARTIYRWMLTGLGDKDYQDLVTETLVDRIADADTMLAEATDACQITRARETARFARMDFERRRPHLYGQKTEVKEDKTIRVIIQRETPQPVDNQANTLDVPSQVVDLADGHTPT